MMFRPKWRSSNVRKFREMSPDKSAAKFLVRCPARSANKYRPKWRSSNVRKFREMSPEKSANMFPGKSAVIFPNKKKYRTVMKFPEKIVTMFLVKFAILFIERNVNRFQRKSARKFPGKSATKSNDKSVAKCLANRRRKSVGKCHDRIVKMSRGRFAIKFPGKTVNRWRRRPVAMFPEINAVSNVPTPTLVRSAIRLLHQTPMELPPPILSRLTPEERGSSNPLFLQLPYAPPECFFYNIIHITYQIIATSIPSCTNPLLPFLVSLLTTTTTTTSKSVSATLYSRKKLYYP